MVWCQEGLQTRKPWQSPYAISARSSDMISGIIMPCQSQMFSLHHVPLEPNSMQWGTWSQEFDLPIQERFSRATLHLGRGQPQRPCHIRLQGSVATIGAPAILLEDSRPQAILKFHHPSSLDYRARHGLVIKKQLISR